MRFLHFFLFNAVLAFSLPADNTKKRRCSVSSHSNVESVVGSLDSGLSMKSEEMVVKEEAKGEDEKNDSKSEEYFAKMADYLDVASSRVASVAFEFAKEEIQSELLMSRSSTLSSKVKDMELDVFSEKANDDNDRSPGHDNEDDLNEDNLNEDNLNISSNRGRSKSLYSNEMVEMGTEEEANHVVDPDDDSPLKYFAAFQHQRSSYPMMNSRSRSRKKRQRCFLPSPITDSELVLSPDSAPAMRKAISLGIRYLASFCSLDNSHEPVADYIMFDDAEDREQSDLSSLPMEPKVEEGSANDAEDDADEDEEEDDDEDDDGYDDDDDEDYDDEEDGLKSVFGLMVTSGNGNCQFDCLSKAFSHSTLLKYAPLKSLSHEEIRKTISDHIATLPYNEEFSSFLSALEVDGIESPFQLANYYRKDGIYGDFNTLLVASKLFDVIFYIMNEDGHGTEVKYPLAEELDSRGVIILRFQRKHYELVFWTDGDDAKHYIVERTRAEALKVPVKGGIWTLDSFSESITKSLEDHYYSVFS